ncbi:MAG: choice-of-anchor tandem repeat GloVer-containing protein [Terriglobales bacterium]|jgi:uncharacterized repeat protein (TIGR03803 family)
MEKTYMLVSTLLAGVLFAIATPLASAQVYTVLHTFTGSPDGVYSSPLIRDAEGNLYGTAQAGGNDNNNCEFGCGMVYKIDPAGNQTVLYDFAGGPNGGYPIAALARDASGNLYGTTEGLGTFNLSVVFKLTPDGQETSFAAPEGSLNAPVVVDAKGNLYGMTPYGGTPNCGWDREELGCGVLFMMTPNGKFTIVHNFVGTDGMFPASGLVRDSKGNFYGAAVFGGIRSCRSVGNGRNNTASGCGTIFKVDVHGNFSVLYTFTGQSDGSGPLGLIIDSGDNLYGIAAGGGDLQGNCCGYGTIFKLDTNTSVYSVLFTFTPEVPGSNPFVTNLLTRDPKGNLYGAQWMLGAHGTGFLFRLDTAGNYTDLFDFQEQSDGFNEDGFFPDGIVLGSARDVYGSMSMGGVGGFGTVFHITP